MFKNDAAEFVYYRTYSRWNNDLQRRETWEETVNRVVNYLKNEKGKNVPEKVFDKVRDYMLTLEVLPSMRLVWTAGPAASQDNLSIYNCSAIALKDLDSFAELMYLLSNGAGVGFSVQEKYISQLPLIQERNFDRFNYTIEDNREGWASSIKVLLEKEFGGTKVEFDYSQIRKKGERLKTFGGRASGPFPLFACHTFIKDTIDAARGRKLTSLECHDICCSISEAIVSGSIRRSACISLFDSDDVAMLTCKSGDNFPYRRAMANNSMVFENKPSAQEFLKFWAMVANEGTGEPGIFNLEQSKARSPNRRDSEKIALCNPCGEALLRDRGLCNLTSVVLRTDDDLDDVFDKIETAAWLGCLQSTFDKFNFVREDWKKNVEEERLLGISLSGQMDAYHLMTEDNLKAMKQKAIKVTRRVAKLLEINMPAAITVVKPEGTSSQLTDASSGIHPRYSKYYIRRYRIGSADPLCNLLKDQGVILKPEIGQKEPNVNTYVIEFPIKSPEGCITRHDLTALQQLEHYKKIQNTWCEMNASMTVYVKEEEWFEVGNWVFKNWEIVNGLSFLPYDGGKYKLAPYEEITEEKYNELIKDFRKIDYSQLSKFEKEDNTEGAKTFSCTGDKCDLT